MLHAHLIATSLDWVETAQVPTQVAAKEELAKVRSISKKRRQGNVRYRTGRDGRAQREALLQTKSHRRESRVKANQGVRSMALTNADEDDDLL